MCSICLPQSGQAPASHVSQQHGRMLLRWCCSAFGPCKQIPSFTMSISKTPAQCRAAKLVYEVLNGHMPEPAQHLFKNGGARRDRTDDLKLAKLPLSQLSYGPVSTHLRKPVPGPTSIMVGLGRFELPTSRLSSARSNQLSYRPESHPAQVCDLERKRNVDGAWSANEPVTSGSMIQ